VHDSYLLLTPLLTLLVVALVGFVGCDKLFGLERVPDAPDPVDPVTGLALTPRDQAVDVNWDDYTGATDYTIHWGDAPGNRPNSRTVTPTDARPVAIMPLPNGAPQYFVVNATVSGMQTPDSEEKSTVPGIYGVPTNLITGKTLGTPRNFTALMGMGIVIGSKRIQATRLGRAVVAGNNGTHKVRIIDKASNMERGSADVSTAGTPAGSFAYADLNPAVLLEAGATYYILSEETMTGDQFFDANTTVMTTAAASREFAAYGGPGGPYMESPTDGIAYGPVDVVYVDLAPMP
jgi:hypothetical protein